MEQINMHQHEESQDDNHGMAVAKYMDPKIYKAAKAGDISGFERAIEDREASPFNQVSPQEDTVLHIAAYSGHVVLVELILTHRIDLFFKKNSNGNLPIHAAAISGHLSIVKSLLGFPQRDSEEWRVSVLREVNKNEETALHVALKNRHKEVAAFLFNLCPRVSSYPNKERKSPLYMAAKAGYLDLVKLMTAETVQVVVMDNSMLSSETRSVVHAALRGRNIDVLEAILKKEPKLVYLKDEDGTTALSYAILVGFLEGVRYLLEKFSVTLYQRDGSGNFPIHVASSEGHIDVIRQILLRCPDAMELLGEQGQNILHVAAKNGKAGVVNYILKTLDLGKLLNEIDEKGNTPLHLAAINGHTMTVHALTWNKRVNSNLRNNDGITARDAAEEKMEAEFSMAKRISWLILQSSTAPKAIKPKSREESPDTKKYRNNMVNTLLLVSILVTTVTFAAGFTLPGGYRISYPHEGMATLVTKPSFQMFLISNNIALYSSIIAAVNLFWAQFGDTKLVNSALNLSGLLLGVSLIMMSVSFMTGVHLVVSDVYWLANIVLAMGLVSLVILLSRSVPLFPWIVQLLLYLPPRLMQLITKWYDGHQKKF
ncbi:Protein ACCELERATED CELL DEATH 6 [Camellia lanceoleosa]|uniref:Protein ACCELERATED CELL DEATH 6 n=1 Tax=Camellia lanceoleosa TaxID=1840588 RepID=A0ACC0GV46_9ERIC|nr:Protein ACCELERATED CELL DEATH 6 [Camellia lanceoleosa]